MKPNWLKFRQIRTRFTFWFLAITLFPFLVILTILYSQQQTLIETSTFEKLTAIRDLKVEQLNSWIDEISADMLVISGDFEIRGLEELFSENQNPANEGEIVETAQHLLTRNLENSPNYSEIFIINSSTSLIEISTNSGNTGKNASADLYYTRPLETGELYISDISLSGETNQPEMVVSTPIYCMSHNKHIIGVLVAKINLNESLYKTLLNRTGLGNSGETLIVNSDVIALNELRWYNDAPLKLKISAEPAVMASKGNTGITTTTDYRGEEILAAYSYISRTRWGFVCKQDLRELNQPIREMLYNFLILFLLTSIIVVFLAFRISQSFSKPIIQLNQNAKKITGGDFSVRNPVEKLDELGSLANQFNKMADEIEMRLQIQEQVYDISKTLIRPSTQSEFGNQLIQKFIEITHANMGIMYVLNKKKDKYVHFASYGANKNLLEPVSATNPPGEIGNAIVFKRIQYLRNIPKKTHFSFNTLAGNANPKEIITLPIIVDSEVIAVITLVNIRKFSNKNYSILEQSWHILNTSYSRIQTNEQTRLLAQHLSKTNEKLEAQTEELQDQAEELQDQAEELQRASEELHHQNIELETQRQQVETANTLKSEFLTNMSHELRTPLNSILALSRVLLNQVKEKLDHEEYNYIEIVERNGKRLLTLINDILDLSKVEAGKMEIVPHPTSVKALLQMIVENISPLAQEKGIDLSLNVPENMPSIETDESRLHQVLLNIVGNAVKFTDKGSIQITSDFDDQKVQIRIKDTGIGISEEMLTHIFEEFRQADGTSSRRYEGTGLGLTIAYKIVEILGGKIEVKSKTGVGSEFTIILPVNANNKTFNKNETNQVQQPNNAILVVDDNPEHQKKIAKCVNEAGYLNLKANTGEEAIKMAEKHQPNAITLDIIMQNMDGWEVLQKLKSNKKTKHIPVIIISVSNDKQTGFALGAVGFIQKPVHKNLLIKELKNISKLPKSVMIVDDNRYELKQIAKVFEQKNINLILANSGKECLEILEHKIPDILVLDLLMPETDGFQVIETIKKITKTKNIPVIVFTAKNLNSKEESRLKGKVNSVITKNSITPNELYKEVIKVLRTEKNIHETIPKTKKQLLIIEDNADAIIQVRAILENNNYLVDVANGGKEALKKLEIKIPDGIILDLMMPEIDGFMFLEEIRNHVKFKHIPVLILTAKDLTKKEHQLLKKHNINQLIHKGDIDINGLLFNVKELIENKSDTNENKQHKILVIEDNPDNMITVTAILNNRFKIFEAESGEKGIAIAQKNKPDVILLDISLPNMDGIQVIEELKKDEKTKAIKIIAVTAQAMDGDKEKLLTAGCNGYVSKPIDTGLLLNEIENVLN